MCLLSSPSEPEKVCLLKYNTEPYCFVCWQAQWFWFSSCHVNCVCACQGSQVKVRVTSRQDCYCWNGQQHVIHSVHSVLFSCVSVRQSNTAVKMTVIISAVSTLKDLSSFCMHASLEGELRSLNSEYLQMCAKHMCTKLVFTRQPTTTITTAMISTALRNLSYVEGWVDQQVGISSQSGAAFQEVPDRCNHVP